MPQTLNSCGFFTLPDLTFSSLLQGHLTTADGAPEKEVAAFERRKKAEQELADATAAVAANEPGAAERLEKAEETLDEVSQ